MKRLHDSHQKHYKSKPKKASFSSNRHPGLRHSTFESLGLGRSSQSIASGFLRFWDSLNFKKDMEFVGITVLFLDEKVNFVIHEFTPVGRANHYMPSLKVYSIVRVDRFEVVSHHGAPEINLQSRLDYVVGQIRSVQCSDLTKETTRVVICLLIDP
ncbi:hypothetical protein F2Q70_00033995 [Brassica cretica]|uniref:DUF223 domain-containing protein n=1 Tax=Brassica cretica TaxID=69181 RepID=A0A8S9JWZ5_BRACR|nr:hypothetical protein F2Q70_00033995 [Brassica cretica]